MNLRVGTNFNILIHIIYLDKNQFFNCVQYALFASLMTSKHMEQFWLKLCAQPKLVFVEIYYRCVTANVASRLPVYAHPFFIIY